MILIIPIFQLYDINYSYIPIILYDINYSYIPIIWY